MKAVKSNELEVGQWAAHMLDLPNCKGIEVMDQGEITKVEHCDMWGTPSEVYTTLVLLPKYGKPWDGKMITVHNSHMWLVRTN